MRVLFPILLALVIQGSLSAQDAVPPDQCLGGRLLSIQQNSITLQFNDRLITMPVAPGAEIWRHGADLESIRQLAPGDKIYLRCERADASGPVIATIVAAPEGDDALNLEPHHITAIGVCIGKLTVITRNSVTLRNEEGTCTVQTNARTMFWRGENLPDAAALQIGDEVDIRYVVGYPGRVLTAESVEANVAKCEGSIVGARSGVILVKDFHPAPNFTVYFDARTRIMDPDNGDEHDFAKLKKKTIVLVIGLDLGHNSMRASTIFIER